MEFETKYLDETKWLRELEALTDEYERMLAFVDQELSTAPEGRLVIQSSKEAPQYSYVGEKGRRYLSKEELPLTKDLAKKAYYIDVQKVLTRLIKRNHYILGLAPLKGPKDIYQQMKAARRELVEPLDGYLQDFIQDWLEKTYERKPFDINEPVILAKNGLRVRSKSEAIIVDLLLDYDIPFKYECPLYLKSLGQIHPDFTVVNRRTGEVFVWEHFGKVDDWNYANRMVKRIEAYHYNGYYEGKNLIYTLESSKQPFGAKDARRIIEQYLL